MVSNFLSALDNLKDSVVLGVFKGEEAFFEAFEALFKGELRHNCLTKEDLETLRQESSVPETLIEVDWRHLTECHLGLLSRVTALHKSEEDALVAKELNGALKTEAVLSQAVDGKRGNGIYLLTEEGFHYDLVGDLHSDPVSLMEILKRTGFVQSMLEGKPHRLVFLGDYVDRGMAHLATVGRLLAVKYCFSEGIFLLRGNHDGGTITGPKEVKLAYKKYDEEADEAYLPTYLIALSNIHPETEPLLEGYLNFFDTLGQLAFIQTGQVVTMAVHGGVPRPLMDEKGYFTYLENLGMLTDANYIDPFGRKMTQNLMWSDPYPGVGDLKEGLGRFYFTEGQFLDFAKTIGIHQIIRGHQWMEEGFRTHFDDKVYTLFSSGQWQGKEDNPMTLYPEVWAKWARLTPEGKIQIQS